LPVKQNWFCEPFFAVINRCNIILGFDHITTGGHIKIFISMIGGDFTKVIN